MARRYRVILVVGFALLAAGLFVYHQHRQRILAAALVSQGSQQYMYPDGRDARIYVVGNANGRTAAVLVFYRGTADPRRREVHGEATYSTSDPLDGLKSSVLVTTHYPPDPDQSGLWIDGRKRVVGDDLSVIYVSDELSATEVAIPAIEQNGFIDDARKLDPLRFIDKWLQRRLSPASG